MSRAFPFETPIAADSLIDRREELHRLHLAATDGAHVRLAGPRRYGKTSLLLAHERSLQQTGWRTVHVDFYGVTSLVEVCARIATAYGRLRDSKVRSQVTALGSRLGLTLSTSGIGMTLGPPQAQLSQESALTAAAELLDLPLRLFERDRVPTLVVFDEFQDLLSAGATLDGLLRSHVQYHGDAATYIYAGSQPSMMRRLFTDRERPLYGQAEPLELSPLPLDEVLVELSERFAALGRDPGDALEPLVVATAGHPQRTMLLAHLLHRELELRESGGTSLGRPEASQLDVEHAGEGVSAPDDLPDGPALADALVDLALAHTSEAHHANWDQLSSGKKAVLAALADGIRPTGSRATERSGLTRAALQSALRDIAREGQHVSRIVTGPAPAGHWRFVDPLFATWVSRRGQRG
ncbi:MAG: AAA-like domain-containing protein [Actinomycetota bacterium]|nr:AAA-like domain-containing protein [Actinomycetota bacterium]